MEGLWDIWRGIFPSACAGLKKGTAVIIEGFAVSIHHLVDRSTSPVK